MSKIKINHTYSHVVVIGASAGGLDALVQLASQLGPEFPAPVLIVQHISPDASGNVLLSALREACKLECKHAVHGESIKAGNIYLAPPDHHLLVHGDGKLQVTRGAQENRYRPSIDPLFRSAAVGFGNRLIGVILTGYLDDGTSGMVAIQRCGGKCIIQDPEDAKYPDMPLNAINQLDADYILPVSEMGSVLSKLSSETIKSAKNLPPEDILVEAKIAERILSDLDAVNSLGEQVPFNCPGCGGVLWKIGTNQELRYRCHTGHAYTYKSLLSEQTSKIEETMWTALRMFEERRNLLITYSKTQKGAAAKSSLERSESSQVHIDRIRAILFSDDNGNGIDKIT